MSRDQRCHDNWALLHAQALAKKCKVGLSVVFCLLPSFHEATARQYYFMLRGLAECEAATRSLGIPFHVLCGNPVTEVPAFVSRHGVCAPVTDMSPLRVGRAWKTEVSAALDPTVPVYEVDAHNIVPVWVASDKLEVSTVRHAPAMGAQRLTPATPSGRRWAPERYARRLPTSFPRGS